jgi:hypothetical protein
MNKQARIGVFDPEMVTESAAEAIVTRLFG